MEAEAARGRRKKLINGVRLALLYPQWNRPCAVCERFIWKRDNPSRVERTAGGDPIEREGDAIPLLCAQCPKVPTWAKEKGKDWRELRALAAEDMTPENVECFEHYKRCRATDQFPEGDELAAHHAALIRDVYDEFERAPAERQTVATLQLIQLITLRTRGR